VVFFLPDQESILADVHVAGDTILACEPAAFHIKLLQFMGGFFANFLIFDLGIDLGLRISLIANLIISIANFSSGLIFIFLLPVYFTPPMNPFFLLSYQLSAIFLE